MLALQHIHAIREHAELLEEIFELSLDQAELLLVRKFVKEVSADKGKVNYHLSLSNVVAWLKLLHFLWAHLEEATRNVLSARNPDADVRILTVFTLCLYELRPIWVHILSLPINELRSVFASAGTFSITTPFMFPIAYRAHRKQS